MNSIGSVEFRSICKGIEASNEILKRNNVDISYAKSVCPGKFLMMFSGDASEVNDAVSLGLEVGGKYVVDHFIINRVHPQIINALKNKYETKDTDGLAIGVVETSKVCAGIKAMDKSLKSGDVNLVKLQLAFAIGGKLVYIVAGTVSSVEHSINMALEILEPKEVVATSVIPSPVKELIDKIT